MYLNTIKPALGSSKQSRRVGRGTGSGRGKTCGKGHKGQHARAGGYHKLGFEGGQVPLQRRLPKFGFRSRKSFVTSELLLSKLNIFDNHQLITLDVLKQKKLVTKKTKFVKIIFSGKLNKSLIFAENITLTYSSREAVLALNGKIMTETEVSDGI